MDTSLGLIVIGQLILISLVMSVRGPRKVAVPLVLLLSSVAAFLVKSSPTLLAAVGGFSLPVIVLNLVSPYFVWYTAYVLFDFERPPTWAMIALPSTTVLMCGFSLFSAEPHIAISIASLLASLTAVFHAAVSTLRGSLDDLCEPRRRFRLCFVGCLIVLSVVILGLELVFVRAQPAWLPMTFTVLVAIGVLLIGVPLLLRPADLLPDTPQPGAGADQLDRAEKDLHQRLTQAMESRAFARTGLTIRQLAEELSLPEHQLRKLINTRLGYKNFSTFLNGYRVSEACDRLADPKEARIPILTIALDAGFASIAPFNRSFRQATGMTPSEYRREKLKPTEVVTALHR